MVYEQPGAVADAYDDLAAAYEGIGAKWTVWVHNGDAETAALLESKGHVLDAAPEAMAADLEATPPARPEPGALEDWTADGDLADVGAINDRAYGYGGDWFSRALTELPTGLVRIYVERRGGEAVGCAAIVDEGDNSRGPAGRGAARGARVGDRRQADRPRPRRRGRARRAHEHAGRHRARPPGLREARLPRR